MLNRIAPGLALGLDVTDYDSDSENGHVEHEVQAMAYSQSAIFGERDDERLDLFARVLGNSISKITSADIFLSLALVSKSDDTLREISSLISKSYS